VKASIAVCLDVLKNSAREGAVVWFHHLLCGYPRLLLALLCAALAIGTPCLVSDRGSLLS
jgi:hypothetical protein